MRWEVTGADRDSGRDQAIIVDAETEDSARRRANRRGLLVARVRAIENDDSVVGMPSVGTSDAREDAPKVHTASLKPKPKDAPAGSYAAEQPKSGKTCARCGALVSASAKHCGVCGAVLTGPSTQVVGSPALHKSPSHSGRRRVLLGLGSLGLLVAGLSIHSVLTSERTPRHPPTDLMTSYYNISPGMTREKVHQILGSPTDDNFPYSQTDTWSMGNGQTIQVHYIRDFDKTSWIADSKDRR